MKRASSPVLFNAATSHRFPKILFRISPAPFPLPSVYGGIVLSTGEGVSTVPSLILQQSQLYTEPFAFL